MTDGTGATGGLELLFGWLIAETLENVGNRKKKKNKL
jgi:hypothetical protein